MTVGENILRIRKEKGMTQFELSNKVALSTCTISRYESGKATPLRAEYLLMIANGLGVRYHELFIDKDGKLLKNAVISKDTWKMIRKTREEKHMTQKDVAEKLGCTERLYQKYESQNVKINAEKFNDLLCILGLCVILPEDMDMVEEPVKAPCEPVQETLFPAETKTDKIVKIIDTLIEALEDIRGELCESN